jgi:hypothetical protein
MNAPPLSFAKAYNAATEDVTMSSPPSPTPYPQQNEPTWSKSEKAIARRAFDAALGRELHDVIQEAKRMANGIQTSSDLWDLEHYLTERRKQIDRKYDYRHSQLTLVFGRLLYENRLSEEDLRGLREDKMKSIRFLAKFFGASAA